jgi:hypothetical protein
MGYVPDYGFDYGYGQMVGDMAQITGTMFLVAMVAYLVILVYGITAYIMGSLGYYTIAMRRGIRHPWLAWVPFGNVWILGSIADQYQFVSLGQVKNRRKVLLGLQIAITALVVALYAIVIYASVMMLFSMGSGGQLTMNSVFGLVYLLICVAILVLYVLLVVFRYIALYNLFASCMPGSKVAFLLLSIFLGFVEPFLVFGCRNKDRGMPPRRTSPVHLDPPVFEE